MGSMEEVSVRPIELDRLAAILPADRAERLAPRPSGRGRPSVTGWCGTSTPPRTAAGSPRCCRPCSPTARGRGSRTAGWCWTVTRGSSRSPSGCTTCCTGSRGTAGRSAPRSTRTTTRCSRANLADLARRVSPRDIVLLHDPQTAGLAEGLRTVGARVVWRCHVGRDRPNDVTEAGWEFLRPYLEHAQALVFSRREYAPEWVDDDRLVVIPPSIDPFAVKNMPLAPEQVTGGPGEGRAGRGRRPGGTGRLRPARRHARDGAVPSADQAESCSSGDPPPGSPYRWWCR